VGLVLCVDLLCSTCDVCTRECSKRVWSYASFDSFDVRRIPPEKALKSPWPSFGALRSSQQKRHVASPQIQFDNPSTLTILSICCCELRTTVKDMQTAPWPSGFLRTQAPAPLGGLTVQRSCKVTLSGRTYLKKTFGSEVVISVY